MARTGLQQQEGSNDCKRSEASTYQGGNQEAKAGAREEPRELEIPAPAMG